MPSLWRYAMTRIREPSLRKRRLNDLNPASNVGLKARPGTYVLLLSSGADARIRVGPSEMRLQRGFYLCVGSAFGPGGARARVKHHLQSSPRPHWHLDYLRPHARVEEVWVCYGGKRREHSWARLLSSKPSVSVPIRGFGSSDCSCEARLFFFEEKAVADGIGEMLSAQEPGLETIR
jgi:Uri superfamily endonuclease